MVFERKWNGNFDKTQKKLVIVRVESNWWTGRIQRNWLDLQNSVDSLERANRVVGWYGPGHTKETIMCWRECCISKEMDDKEKDNQEKHDRSKSKSWIIYYIGLYQKDALNWTSWKQGKELIGKSGHLHISDNTRFKIWTTTTATSTLVSSFLFRYAVYPARDMPHATPSWPVEKNCLLPCYMHPRSIMS